MGLLLKDIRYLVTQDGARRVLERVSVRVEGDRIGEIAPDLAPRNDEVTIDCTDKILLPGLVNAHTHLGMTALRGISDDKELHEWLDRILAEERRLTPEAITAASRLGAREAVRNGTTTIVDMYYRPDAVATALRAVGVRAIIGATFLHGHPLSAEGLDLPDDDGRIRYALAPHSIYATDEILLRRVRGEAARTGRRIMIHLSETRKERAEWKAKTGLLPVEYLEKIGFLGPDVLAAHCVWLTKGELDILAKRGVKVAHCPQSNMKLAGGGVMPLREMRERGITVALGTDSAASNNALDMFREMHACALLHKHHYWDPTVVGAQEALDMATRNAAFALNIPDICSVEVGKKADLIALDLSDPNLQPHSAERIVSHLAYAANGMNVSDVIVDGEILLRDRKFVRSP